MTKVPKSVYEEIKHLEEKLKSYKEWKKDDTEKIRLIKEIWKIDLK